MSAEVTIALGVAGRVLANVACAQNPRLGAALVGISNGFLIHRAWIANTLLDPLTLLILAAGFAFDHLMYGGFEETLTAVLGCGLGVVLADFGPDLWYEIFGEQVTKDLSREMVSLFPFLGGDDSASDVDDRSDVGSVVSKATASSRRTSRSNVTGTSVTVRPSRPRPTPRPASTITRSSRVTFDESSITQSQSSDIDAEELETDLGTSTRYGLGTAANGLTTTDGDTVTDSVLSSANGDLYMAPSMTSGSSYTRVHTRPAPPSILRRLHIPRQDSPSIPQRALSQSSSSTRTRLTSDGETTPRATTYPIDFSPLPQSSLEPPPPHFPEPDLSNGHSYENYSPQIIPPSEPTPDLSTFIPLPEPAYYPPPPKDLANDGGEREPSRLERILNVPIVPPETEEERHEERPATPESARLWVPPDGHSASRRSKSRSRSRSPAGPRPQPPHDVPLPVEIPGPPAYITENSGNTTASY